MLVRRIQPSESGEFDTWIRAHHYRGCVPPGAVLRLEFLEGCRVGAMMWGRPTARMLEQDADHIFELTRMFFKDEVSEQKSQFLSQARKFIRKWFPQIRLCLAYSDPAQGHDGTVYLADGWSRFGRTSDKKVGWANREGRFDACGQSKIRFVRTP